MAGIRGDAYGIRPVELTAELIQHWWNSEEQRQKDAIKQASSERERAAAANLRDRMLMKLGGIRAVAEIMNDTDRASHRLLEASPGVQKALSMGIGSANFTIRDQHTVQGWLNSTGLTTKAAKARLLEKLSPKGVRGAMTMKAALVDLSPNHYLKAIGFKSKKG